MRSLALTVVLVLSWCSLARADAIEPFEGECPPGLDEGISHHAEVCSPRACSTDAQCGAHAACRAIAECWAPRETSPSDGRVADDTVLRDQVIGLCTPAGTCAEGHCATRRQCEPTVSTEAWDPTSRSWTGMPYHSGCAVTPGARGGAAGWLVLGLALVGLAARHRIVRR